MNIRKGETVASYRKRLLDYGILQKPIRRGDTCVVYGIALYKAIWWNWLGGFANTTFSPKLKPIKSKNKPQGIDYACKIMQLRGATWAKQEEDDEITTDVRGDYFNFYTPDFLWRGTYFVETRELQYRPDKSSNKKAIISVN